MINADIVCESNLVYASSVFLVKKKTDEKGLSVDCRALNNKTGKIIFIIDRRPLRSISWSESIY